MRTREAELAISRVVDRRETLADWALLERWAAEDTTIYQQIAATLRDDCTLRLALERRLASVAPAAGPGGRTDPQPLPLSPPARRAYSSWALGAALALVGFLVAFIVRTQGSSEARREPEALLTRYLDAGAENGNVLEPLPNVTLDVRPAAQEGAVEVIFMRRILERAVVREGWRIGSDEHGRPQPARVDLASFKATTSF